MSTITTESIADTIEGLEHLANSGIQSVYIDMAIAGMRRLQSSLEAEPVHQVLTGDAWVDLSKGGMDSQKRVGAIVRTVYTAPPTPISVPEEDLLHIAASAIEDLLSNKDRSGAGVWADIPAKLRRAAMLQGADGNSPVVPDGYALVPVEPTEKMLNAWLSEVANWRGHVAGYKAMLAAAPQQEVK